MSSAQRYHFRTVSSSISYQCIS